jgi:hypothetical protein
MRLRARSRLFQTASRGNCNTRCGLVSLPTVCGAGSVEGIRSSRVSRARLVSLASMRAVVLLILSPALRCPVFVLPQRAAKNKFCPGCTYQCVQARYDATMSSVPAAGYTDPDVEGGWARVDTSTTWLRRHSSSPSELTAPQLLATGQDGPQTFGVLREPHALAEINMLSVQSRGVPSRQGTCQRTTREAKADAGDEPLG